MLLIDSDNTKDRQLKNKIINELMNSTLVITFPQNNDEVGYERITEKNIVSESMILKQSICDEGKLKFGGCIASEFSIQLINTEDRTFTSAGLKGKFIRVRLTQTYPTGDFLVPANDLVISDDLVAGEIVQKTTWTLFSGYIDTAPKSQDNDNIFEVTAYDPISRLYEKKITGKLKKALKVDGTPNYYYNLLSLCLKNNLYSTNSADYGAFLNKGQYGNVPWVKDPTQITKGELLSNLCEIAGGFGYWSSTEGKVLLLNINQSSIVRYEFYENLKVENLPVFPFDSVLFSMGSDAYDTEKNTGLYVKEVVYDESDVDLEDYNYYDLSDNVLAWDYDSNGSYHYNFISGFYQTVLNSVTYTPFTATVDGRPWLEVGDKVRILTPKTNIYGEYVDSNNQVVESYDEADKEIIDSYVFSRTLKGVKALTDEIEARGDI